MLGAGDIKLFSVISGVSGVYSIIDVMTVSLFFGALLSVIFLIRHRNLRSRLQYLAAYFSKIIIKKEILPYAQQIGNVEAYHKMNREEHIKRGHIHYSAAILYAVIFCRMSR
jgi:Flp pilus assembly protein protease CpaA